MTSIRVSVDRGSHRRQRHCRYDGIILGWSGDRMPCSRLTTMDMGVIRKPAQGRIDFIRGIGFLPHNGYVVTTIRSICNETHEAALWGRRALTVIVPAIGVIIAIVLFSLGFGNKKGVPSCRK